MAAKKNPVGWFEIYVQDMDRARAFYEAMLETQLERMPETPLEMFVFPMAREAPDISGALVRMEGVASGGGGTLVYFYCDDCGATAERAAAHGGSISKPKTSIGAYGQMALVVDTEGNMIGLHSAQ